MAYQEIDAITTPHTYIAAYSHLNVFQINMDPWHLATKLRSVITFILLLSCFIACSNYLYRISLIRRRHILFKSCGCKIYIQKGTLWVHEQM